MNNLRILYISVSLLSLCQTAFAADKGRFGELGLGYTTLSGDKNKSLGNPNSQLSLEFGTGQGNAFAAYLFKLRVDSSSGNASFLDGGTSKSLAYKELAGNIALGFRITPIPTPREKGIIIYFGATGDVGLAQLRLPDQTYSTLTASQSGMTLGYEIFTGADFILGHATNPWGCFAQISLKQQSGNFGGQNNFALGGLMFSGGFVW